MYEKLPKSELIFSDTAKDGSLTITVWHDFAQQTDLMQEAGVEAMGILRIYDNTSATMLHKERVPLSHTTIFGSGPTEEEVSYWEGLVERFSTD